MSKKEQQKVGLSAKNLLPQAPKQKREKEAFAKKGEKNPKGTKKKEEKQPTVGSLCQSANQQRVSSRIKGPPSFMICSRATSLCTLTALVEIRCCGPSSWNRGRGWEGGGESERVKLQQQTLPGLPLITHSDWQPPAGGADGSRRATEKQKKMNVSIKR